MIGGPECMTAEERLEGAGFVQSLEEKGDIFTVFKCLMRC